MHVLFLGFSNLFETRILPYLESIQGISKVDIAKYQNKTKDKILKNNYVFENIYNSFEIALEKSDAELVYISTVNSAHAYWVEKFLLKGYHVIVDKPSVLDFVEAQKIVDLAIKNNLCLVESLVYILHPQINTINEILIKHKTDPTRLIASFSIPPLKLDNFRYKKELGGGAIFDTAPYAVSIGRILFKEQPKSVVCKVNSVDKNNLELSYSILLNYSKGRSLVGHFGFDTEYINRLTILGKNIMIELDRIFTSTPTLKNKISVKFKNEKYSIKAPRGNSFTLFIQEVINKIKFNNYQDYYYTLLEDAKTISEIRKSL